MNARADILIGLPATGKTSWVEKRNYRWETVECDPSTYVYLSTDQILEQYAAANNCTYDDAFNQYMHQAQKQFWQKLEQTIEVGQNLVVDRTNLTAVSRSRIISKIRSSRYQYDIDGLIFGINLNPYQWHRRLNSRKGKTIPPAQLAAMALSFQYPTHDEGFNAIVEIY